MRCLFFKKQKKKTLSFQEYLENFMRKFTTLAQENNNPTAMHFAADFRHHIEARASDRHNSFRIFLKHSPVSEYFLTVFDKLLQETELILKNRDEWVGQGGVGLQVSFAMTRQPASNFNNLRLLNNFTRMHKHLYGILLDHFAFDDKKYTIASELYLACEKLNRLELLNVPSFKWVFSLSDERVRELHNQLEGREWNLQGIADIADFISSQPSIDEIVDEEKSQHGLSL